VLHLKFFCVNFVFVRTEKGSEITSFIWRDFLGKLGEKIMAYKNESLINTTELGRAIKRRREELGMSLRDVADATAGFGFNALTHRKRNRQTGRR
jgi:hypothetical protein